MKRVFIEGLPGAGKTTTTKLLRAAKLPVAQDFGLATGADDYPGDGTTIDEVLAIDDWFIHRESERLRSDAGIFDRSYLGNLTYAYAYSRLKGLGSFEPTTRKYEQAIELGKLALPEGLVYIDVDPELSIERQHQRALDGVPLLDVFWRDRHFLQDIRDAHQALFNACAGIAMLTLHGETPNAATAHDIISFYHSLDATRSSQNQQLQLDQYIASLST